MLRVQIAKRADGTGVLSCQRADGSTTWQRQTARNAGHLALHDLTHFAVETTLRYKRGFFGMIAEGWEIEDTTGKGARGPLPREATEVETLVGLFDRERGPAGLQWSADEFNSYSPRTLTQLEIDAVRECRARIFERWSAIQAGSKLELSFSTSQSA